MGSFGIRCGIVIAVLVAASLSCFVGPGAAESDSPAPALELTVRSSVWGRVLDTSMGFVGHPSPQLPPSLTLASYEGVEGTSTWIHAGFNYSAAAFGPERYPAGTLYLQGYAVIPEEAERDPTVDSYAFVTHAYATEPTLSARLGMVGLSDEPWVFIDNGEYRLMSDAGIASVLMLGYHPYLLVTAPGADHDDAQSDIHHRWFFGSPGGAGQGHPGLEGVLDVHQGPHAMTTGHAVEYADWEHYEGVADVALSPYILTVRGLPAMDDDPAATPADGQKTGPGEDAQERGPEEDAPRDGARLALPTFPSGNDRAAYDVPPFWLPVAVVTAFLALANGYVRFAVLRGFASVGLFTRFTRDSALDHPRREFIVRCIEQNTGASFSQLRRETDLGSGVLSHHLRILERAGQIRSFRDGPRARFYVGPRPANMKPTLSLPQEAVLDAISRHPGASARALAGLTGVPESNVYYHVARLAERKLVRLDRERGRRRFYPS